MKQEDEDSFSINNQFSNQQKQCTFFVDSNYFGNSPALKRAFTIKNTVMKVFKYGTKDFFRFSNATLIERHDSLEDTLKVLRTEPKVYGNQKRKRMLKYYDRVTKLINRIHIRKDENKTNGTENETKEKT